jgi:ADP-ribosylglycohydrolase
MKSNREILDWLFDEGRINVERGPLFGAAPGPLPPDLDFDRVRGMMLGLAIGDALGNTSEGLAPRERRALWGEVRDYLPNPFAAGRRVGLPSDDTQLAFWALERILADGGLVPESLARTFSERSIFGIGQTVSGFLAAHRAGRPWYECGPRSAGNGALMRIAPLATTADPWVDTALAAMMTHNDHGSTAACIAFVTMLRRLLAMAAAPPPEWWLESYVTAARGLEGETAYTPRYGEHRDYRGPIWRFVEEHVAAAHARGLPIVEACEAWGSGAYLLETMPCVVLILMRHANDAEQAITRAVNDTRDNDTIGAIVGAAVGALHGARGLPERWRGGLLGRTAQTDDGRVIELLDRAEQAFRRPRGS